MWMCPWKTASDRTPSLLQIQALRRRSQQAWRWAQGGWIASLLVPLLLLLIGRGTVGEAFAVHLLCLGFAIDRTVGWVWCRHQACQKERSLPVPRSVERKVLFVSPESWADMLDDRMRFDERIGTHAGMDVYLWVCHGNLWYTYDGLDDETTPCAYDCLVLGGVRYRQVDRPTESVVSR